MKIAALILGILGGLFGAMLGIKWISDANQARELVNALAGTGMTAELDALVRAGYALIAALPLAIVASVLTVKDKGKVGAALFALALLVPAIFAAKTLIATFFLGIAALLAALSKPKAAPSLATGAA